MRDVGAALVAVLLFLCGSCVTSKDEAVNEELPALKAPVNCNETCTEYRPRETGKDRATVFLCSEMEDRKKHPCRVDYKVSCNDEADVCKQSCPSSSQVEATSACTPIKAPKKKPSDSGPVTIDPMECEYGGCS